MLLFHTVRRPTKSVSILRSSVRWISDTSSRTATSLIRFLDEKQQLRCGQPKDFDGHVPPSADLVEGNDPFGSLTLTAETKKDIPRNPVLFMKNISSICNPFQAIKIPSIASSPPEVDYEGELAVVIGKDCLNVSADTALDYVLGYTVGNDVSARRWQGKKGGGQWGRGKSFDTFCPLGPSLVTTAKITDPQSLAISTTVNGQMRQQSSTSDMIFTVAELVSYLSRSTTLPQGTVILTGTPEGVGYTMDPPQYLRPGDEVSVTVEGIGCLSNHLESE